MDDDEMDLEEGTIVESDEERNMDEDGEEGSENGDEEDPENDEDEDEDDDDEEEEEEEEEEDDGDEDDEDDDDMDDADGDSRQRGSPSSNRSASPNAYLRAVQQRRSDILASSSNRAASSYVIDPVGAAPHASHVHAMALSADGTTLLSGGSDGHVRKYDVYASMNAKSMLTQNVRHQFVDGVLRAGVLSAWWANEEVPQVKGEEDFEEEHLVSPVHSLAVQQESLWSLSGTESGNINLSSLRHEPGQLRHVLRRHTAAVSALALTNDDTELISGGWDRSVLQWDLHTGQVVRSFPGHAGQISSISFRPLQQGQSLWDAEPQSPAISIRNSALPPSPGRKPSRDRSASTQSARTPSNGKAVHSNTTTPAKSNKSPLKQQVAAAGRVGGGESTEATASPQTSSINGDASTKAPLRIAASSGKENGSNAATPATPSAKGKEAEESLFGEEGRSDDMELERDLNEALGLGENGEGGAGDGKMVGMDDGEEMQELDRPSNANATLDRSKDKERDRDADSEGDSLFGGESGVGSPNGDGDADAEGDADGDADADGEADLDAEGEDAEGEDDDEPLAARLPMAGAKAAASAGLELPGGGGTFAPSNHTIPNQELAGDSTPSLAAPRRKPLPEPTFGGHEIAAGFDGDVSKFSNDILLTSTLGGQVTLWDKRVPSYTSTDSSQAQHKGVRALTLPDKTPPWCMSACWNSRGDKIYVGRRNETIDEWDLRMIPDVDTNHDSALGPSNFRKGNARFARALRFPHGSGPVTAVTAMPNGRHIVCGSLDNVRLWDTQALDSKIPFRIVAGHHGATVSQIIIDPTCRFLFTSSGDRGWLSSSTETVLLHEIQAQMM